MKKKWRTFLSDKIKKICKSRRKIIKKSFKLVTLVFSLVALFFSCEANKLASESGMLNYYVTPIISSIDKENKTVNMELIFEVSSGAVGDVRILKYTDGDISQIANNRGGIIKKGAKKDEKTFDFVIEYLETNQTQFLLTFYIFVEGRDGSRQLDMIMCHINLDKESKIYYYTTLDLIINEDDELNIYEEAFDDYRALYNLLKKENEL